MTEATAAHSSDTHPQPGLGQQPQAEHPIAQAVETAQQQEVEEVVEDEAWRIKLIDR